MAVATTAQVKARIIAILKTNSTLSGNSHVFDGSVRDVNLYPAFLVFAAEATHEKTSVDQKITTRDFDIWGLIQPSEEGGEVAAELAVEPWLDTIPALFDPRPGLWLLNQQDPLAGVQEAYLTEDTGFSILPMAGADHAGCIWTLRVQTESYLSEGA